MKLIMIKCVICGGINTHDIESNIGGTACEHCSQRDWYITDTDVSTNALWNYAPPPAATPPNCYAGLHPIEPIEEKEPTCCDPYKGLFKYCQKCAKELKG